MSFPSIPEARIRSVEKRDVRPDGDFVLYWMTAYRRANWNFSLQRAVDWSRELGKPLVVLEALRSGYEWASDRLHRFVLDGMLDNRKALDVDGVTYYPYVEPEPGDGQGLLKALARHAAVLIADDYPCFFLPRMLDSAERQVAVRMERVDSNGLLPVGAADRVYPTAYAFRRLLQRTLPEHLGEFPKSNPLARVKLPRKATIPASIRRRWPALPDKTALDKVIAGLPIDHSVVPTDLAGGSAAAGKRLRAFLDQRLEHYEERNQPEKDVASGLSPYLHFGHVSSHEVFHRLARQEQWGPQELSDRADGRRSGWWGMSPAAQGFLDQIVTWRELGFNMTARQDDYDRYRSLPAWARATLSDHLGDERPNTYTLRQFERARTHDELWNAAQTQLVREGVIHNYLRMLWGKKILEWSRTPRAALKTMLVLNNKYALDGRDPNSYSGIFWVLGRYDRAWGPERKIFGKVRYMTSANTARKVSVKGYIEKYQPED